VPVTHSFMQHSIYAMTSATNNPATNIANNTYCRQHQCKSRQREWFEPCMVLDAFVILICEPHGIDDLLYDWCLEKATTLVLQERPMLSTRYQSLQPACHAGHQTLNVKLAPSLSSSTRARFFLIADLVWLLWKLNMTLTRGQTLALSSLRTCEPQLVIYIKS